ncbi:DUF3499 domain-containing protein [Enemella sp. A6]|uniref:DUF3499 domain-containing protein n=1 Tax=Enemella sp. A6 TaxID=3440152 RepID=UPI003EBAD2C1
MAIRQCSRTGCSARAVATLTYAYADSTAILGPLAQRTEPGTYDICEQHCSTLSAPRGWEIIRLPMPDQAPVADGDDLLALANAVREVGFSYGERAAHTDLAPGSGVVEVGRKAHLRVLTDPDA